MRKENQESRSKNQEPRKVLVLGSDSVAVLYRTIKSATMNNSIKSAILLLILVTASCTDVIDVPLQTETPRLVVEASLDWEKGTVGNEQTIKLSTSTEFYDTTSRPVVTGASVQVTNDSDGTEFIFTDENNGEYITTEFVPVIGQSYTLEIIYNGETYTAQETLNSVTEITRVYQSTEDGESADDLEVQVVFTDPQEEGNHYMFKFQRRGDLLPDLEIGDDEFVNGNEIEWWYELEGDDDTEEVEGFQPGDVVDIEMYGTSDAYNNYLLVLLNQGGVAIFDTTPVAVRGNVINLTNPDRYAHGYFRVTEVNRTSHTFE